MSRIKIQVLEPDLEKCEALLMEAMKAHLGWSVVAEVNKVLDIDKIKKYDVSETPAVVINNKVKVCGRVPSKEEIREWIKEEYGPPVA